MQALLFVPIFLMLVAMANAQESASIIPSIEQRYAQSLAACENLALHNGFDLDNARAEIARLKAIDANGNPVKKPVRGK